MINCPLCNTHAHKSFVNDNKIYYRCPICDLVFCDPGQLPCFAEERSRYELHENSIQNTGYVSFLNRAIVPAIDFINSSMNGLDFGCGPGPTISELLKQRNIHCINYDPIFFPIIPEYGKFDFIFATECFEHFHYPAKEIDHIMKILKNKGFLIIMTELTDTILDLKKWYYIKDSTHVSLYSQKTFSYICNTYGFTIRYSDNKRVLILQIN